MSFEAKAMAWLGVAAVAVVALPFIGIAWFEARYECVSQHAEMWTSPAVGVQMPNSPIVITGGSQVREVQVCDEWRKR